MNRRRFLATLTGAVIAPHLPKPAPLISPGEVLFFLDPAEFVFKPLRADRHYDLEFASMIAKKAASDAIFVKLAINLYVKHPREVAIMRGQIGCLAVQTLEGGTR